MHGENVLYTQSRFEVGGMGTNQIGMAMALQLRQNLNPILGESDKSH